MYIPLRLRCAGPLMRLQCAGLLMTLLICNNSPGNDIILRLLYRLCYCLCEKPSPPTRAVVVSSDLLERCVPIQVAGDEVEPIALDEAQTSTETRYARTA